MKPIAPSRRQYLWYSMYVDALSEADPALMNLRVKEAVSLLLARERALHLSSEDNSEERQALTATLLALRVLRNCLMSPEMRRHAA